MILFGFNYAVEIVLFIFSMKVTTILKFKNMRLQFINLQLYNFIIYSVLHVSTWISRLQGDSDTKECE
jgi:hypothetical protein